MNFIEQIKSDISNLRNHQGLSGRVFVNANSLRELIDQYEAIDSVNRALDEGQRMKHVNQQLSDLIEACYHQQGQDSESTLMIIMKTLIPLMENKKYKDCI